MSDARVAEASAPCSVELAGGGLDAGATRASGLETTTVRVAIDRRAWSRVEIGGAGVQVESKDTLQKMSVGNVDEWIAGGRMVAVAHALRASGLETGVRVELQARIPEGSGLGEMWALAVATAGAACGVLGRAVDPKEIARVLAEVRRATGIRTGEAAELAALRGGTVAAPHDMRAERPEGLGVDPARVEESLLLVDSGSTRPGGEDGSGAAEGKDGPEARDELARAARELRHALTEGRFEAVVDLFAAEWEARKLVSPRVTNAEINRIVDLVRGAGGAARACGPGPGGLVAAWAPPGERAPGRREAVEEALAGAGLRVFPARVDLLGLDLA